MWPSSLYPQIKPQQNSHSIEPVPDETQHKKPFQKRRTWTCQENILYTRFLKVYTKKFSINDGDKKFRKYKRMSVFMVSKTPKQCRTHHQKMMIKYETVENIIENLCVQRNEQKQQQKTEKNQQSPKSIKNSNSQVIQTGQEQQKNEKSIPSYSSEFIFDILF